MSERFKAEVTAATEYGTNKPCQIGRIAYTEGAHRYVALAFRYTGEEASAWSLTWLGHEGGELAQLPKGISPTNEMLAALDAGGAA